jgi:hypothetical protein
MLSDEQRKELELMRPIRVVVRIKWANNVRPYNPTLVAMTEESFSMGWEERRVNIFWSSINRPGATIKIDGERGAKANMGPDAEAMIFDPLDEECPIQINWEAWFAAQTAVPFRKYDARNAPFIVRPGGLWKLRALVAERRALNAEDRNVDLARELREAEIKLAQINAVLNPRKEDE